MTNEPIPSGRKKIIVLVSGSGTNLQAILDAIKSGEIDAEVTLVVSNRKAAFGLTRAEHCGVPSMYFPLKPYRDAGKSREEYDTNLAAILTQHNPDVIVLAGWMHVFSTAFLQLFAGKVINLHPALPGTFPGTDSIHRAFEAWQRGEITHSGCMVHYVIPEVDAGPVIAQSVVPFSPDDTPESYEARMHAAEHRLIATAVQKAIAST
jgi:formyltetrahydrofolate-dependent phosphoribosylglycinamide formyltransferase